VKRALRLAYSTLGAESLFNPYVRRADESYPASEIDNKKNEQNGPKNAATDIHLILRLFVRGY
jgi:hypothetical protein